MRCVSSSSLTVHRQVTATVPRTFRAGCSLRAPCVTVLNRSRYRQGAATVPRTSVRGAPLASSSILFHPLPSSSCPHLSSSCPHLVLIFPLPSSFLSCPLHSSRVFSCLPRLLSSPVLPRPPLSSSPVRPGRVIAFFPPVSGLKPRKKRKKAIFFEKSCRKFCRFGKKQ